MTNSTLNSESQKLDKAFLGHPKPLKGLFFVEMWERFSYYGIRPLLILFMTATLMSGGFEMDDATAAAIYGIFGGMMYLTPLIGGWLADNWLGQEKALWWGSIIIALGHLWIGLSGLPSVGKSVFFIGLMFIVLGSGLFKTCISVMVGALYDKDDERRDSGFTIFYMGINIGAMIAPLITGWFAQRSMWHWGFGAGGVGMIVALLLYRFMARPNLQQFVSAKGMTASWQEPKQRVAHVGKGVMIFSALLILVVALAMTGVIYIDPVFIRDGMIYLIVGALFAYFGWAFITPSFSKGEKVRLLVCFLLIIGASLFWSSFEQQPTSFNLFAERYTNRTLFDFEIPTVWFQALNSIFVILLAPVVGWIWVKLASRNLNPSSMVKFALGMLFAAASFAVMTVATNHVIAGDEMVSPLWIAVSLLLLTLGELCLSPVGLSSMTRLAPDRIQGVIMGLFFVSISLGGLIGSISGGYVSGETISDLPKLFTTLTIFLVVSAVVMLLLAKPIDKLLKDTQDSSTPS